MDSFDSLLTELVLPRDQNSQPDINGLVAGFTNSKASRYVTARGVKHVETMEPVALDSMLAFFSCTKPMTAMAVLKLWEDGKVDLDAPAKKYLPLIGEIGLIEPGQVDDDTGDFLYPPKKPKNDVTIRHLLLNNSGFAYAFTDSDYFTLAVTKQRDNSAANPLMKLFTTEAMPLIFEPGTQWRYGHSMDWAGLVVEAVSGMKLSAYLQKNVFDKADMKHCTFRMENESEMIQLHGRKSEGQLRPMKGKPVPFKPKVDMGGQGCFGTVGDYLKFLRIWLNYGTSPDTGIQILERKTVEYAIQNHLPDGQFVELDTAMNRDMPSEFQPDGFSLTGSAYNMNDLPTGRPKGSIYWGGLASLYYWIDFENDCAGFFGCQVLPYLDLKCLLGYIRFEHAVYEMLKKEKLGKL